MIREMPVKNFLFDLLMGMTFAILLLIFFYNLSEVYPHLDTLDKMITDFIQSFSTPLLTTVMTTITHLGSGIATIIVVIVASYFLIFKLKHIWECVVLSISLLGGWLLNVWLKGIYERSRPEELYHLVEAGGFSFPSGHAMVSTAFYGMLTYIIVINLRDQGKIFWPVTLIGVIFIFSMGISRIYLGVHYPSDVIAGFAAGSVWLISCILALKVIRFYKS